MVEQKNIKMDETECENVCKNFISILFPLFFYLYDTHHKSLDSFHVVYYFYRYIRVNV